MDIGYNNSINNLPDIKAKRITSMMQIESMLGWSCSRKCQDYVYIKWEYWSGGEGGMGLKWGGLDLEWRCWGGGRFNF